VNLIIDSLSLQLYCSYSVEVYLIYKTFWQSVQFVEETTLNSSRVAVRMRQNDPVLRVP